MPNNCSAADIYIYNLILDDDIDAESVTLNLHPVSDMFGKRCPMYLKS